MISQLPFRNSPAPDGQDAFATSTVPFDAGLGGALDRKLRVGWMVGPGFGPIDTQVAATVKAAAEALRGEGHHVEEVRIRRWSATSPWMSSTSFTSWR